MAKTSKRKNRYIKPAVAEDGGQPMRRWLPLAVRTAAGVAMILAMGLVCIFSYDWITQSAYFRADEIVVNGCSRLDPETIKETAQLSQGVNILSVNLASAKKRLKADPWIDDAAIRRAFPPKLTIDISEHKPIAVVDFGRLFLINERGEIFKAYKETDPASLPLIKGISYRSWTAGGFRDARARDAVMTLLRLGDAENSVIPGSRIETIMVDKEIGLSLEIREPAKRIELGFGDYEKKLERFAEITSHVAHKDKEKAFSVVDLKNPDRIVARPVKKNEVIAGKGGSGEGT